MIKSIVLKNSQFATNLIQGPLAGVSCAPFRWLTWRYSQPAFTCTEMISCKTLLQQSVAARKRFITVYPEEGPVCFQLAGSEPLELAEATKIATDAGAAIIDLNCGCPVNKIRSKGVGSSLLSKPKEIYRLICAMKQNTHLPVSIKIRVQGLSADSCNAEIAKVVAEAGADFLVVHGRNWRETYETPCRYEEIRFFVEALKIPVIGNGDIACALSLKKMLATGCAGVMIGRAGVGQPWLIKKLAAELQGEVFSMPTDAEVGAAFFEHVHLLSKLLGSEKFALLQARKFAKYYARNLPKKLEFCTAMHSCGNIKDFFKLCEQYFVKR